MPQLRKYKDSGERMEAFYERHPDYQNSDRVREIKREWARANRPECPRCECGARLKGEKSRKLGLCSGCQRKRLG
ncbi:MAG: hypothetical protein ACRC11_10980 [Xenococcaceae cyanobacterium]